MATCNTVPAYHSPRPDISEGTVRISSTPGSLDGPASFDTGDEECFSIELDVTHRSLDSEHRDVTVVLDLLASGHTESQVEGLQVAAQNIQTDSWLASFIRSDGVGLCVELMGCFSPSSVQRAAANVCTQIAASSFAACEMLLAADVGSMIEQHIKKAETTLQMFEDASYVVSAIARHPALTANAFEQRNLMPYFVSVLTDTSEEAAAARRAALTAANTLCASWSTATVAFLNCGGVPTVLQTLLQPERGSEEISASVQLLNTAARSREECKEIMSENGVMGIEVLVQVHRDAGSQMDMALSSLSAQTIALLTHKHPLNMMNLENCSRLLGDEGLVREVLTLHSQLLVGGMTSPTGAETSHPLPGSLSTASTGVSDPLDQPDVTSPGMARKHSLDSSRAFLRMGSSMKSMLGSVRKFMRSERSVSEDI